MKSRHNGGMPRTGDNIRIPLPEDEVLKRYSKSSRQKHTPRPGATKKKDKPK